MVLQWVARSVVLRCYLQIFLKILFISSGVFIVNMFEQRTYLLDFSFELWIRLGTSALTGDPDPYPQVYRF